MAADGQDLGIAELVNSDRNFDDEYDMISRGCALAEPALLGTYPSPRNLGRNHVGIDQLLLNDLLQLLHDELLHFARILQH